METDYSKKKLSELRNYSKNLDKNIYKQLNNLIKIKQKDCLLDKEIYDLISQFKLESTSFKFKQN